MHFFFQTNVSEADSNFNFLVDHAFLESDGKFLFLGGAVIIGTVFLSPKLTKRTLQIIPLWLWMMQPEDWLLFVVIFAISFILFVMSLLGFLLFMGLRRKVAELSSLMLMMTNLLWNTLEGWDELFLILKNPFFFPPCGDEVLSGLFRCIEIDNFPLMMSLPDIFLTIFKLFNGIQDTQEGDIVVFGRRNLIFLVMLHLKRDYNV